MENTLIVVLGPTASGKTNLAIKLAQEFGAEIISADSRQFFKEMPIGTAAPSSVQKKAIKHHFVGDISVHEEYNVSRFEKDVLELLENRFPVVDPMIMVGGSGLYIDAVCKGIDELPNPDLKLRANLNALYKDEGIEALQLKLKTLDAEYYKIVDLNNPKRLLRAIEVSIQTNKPYSSQRLNNPKKRDFRILKVGLDIPRDKLNERINFRTDLMLKEKWIDEARELLPFKDLNALNTVGYKELFKYLEGEWSLELATEKIKTNTRRYAKRQMTWFRRDTGIRWFDPGNVNEIIDYLRGRLRVE